MYVSAPECYAAVTSFVRGLSVGSDMLSGFQDFHASSTNSGPISWDTEIAFRQGEQVGVELTAGRGGQQENAQAIGDLFDALDDYFSRRNDA